MYVGTLNLRPDLPKPRYTTDSPAPFYWSTAAYTEHCCTLSHRRQLLTTTYSVHIPEDTNLQHHLCENLKSRIAKLLFVAARPNYWPFHTALMSQMAWILIDLAIFSQWLEPYYVLRSLPKHGTTGLWPVGKSVPYVTLRYLESLSAHVVFSLSGEPYIYGIFTEKIHC